MRHQDCAARLRRIENELQRLEEQIADLDQSWETGGNKTVNRGLLRLNERKKQLFREREAALGEFRRAA